MVTYLCKGLLIHELSLYLTGSTRVKAMPQRCERSTILHTFGSRRIIICNQNERSWKLLERLGRELLLQNIYFETDRNGALGDTYEYAILKNGVMDRFIIKPGAVPLVYLLKQRILFSESFWSERLPYASLAY